MSELEKKTIIPFECQVDIKKSYEDNEKWYIEGYAGSTELDLVGDIITEDAFKKAETDLINNSTVLYNHDPEKPIGKVEEAIADKNGLKIKALISKTAPEIWQQVKEGVLNKFSIRGRVENAVKKFIKEIGGEIINKVVNVINEIYLIEASLVALPANPEAKALRWYISKSLQDFELKGGEIPEENDRNIVLKGGNMAKIEELFKQIGDRLVADEDKALLVALKTEIGNIQLKKKSGEELKQEDIVLFEKAIEDLQNEVEKAKKEKKPMKPLAEMNAEEMKEIVSLSDEIRKQYAAEHPYPAEAIKSEITIKKATGEAYTQAEIDVMVKDLNDFKVKIAALEVELNAIKTEKEIAKRWDAIKNEYDENDASSIQAILKKSILGETLSAEDTEALVIKKLQPSRLRMGIVQTEIKEMTDERKKNLIKLGGIKTKNK